MAYVVGLEADAPNPDWDVFQRTVDKLVQSFQPSAGADARRDSLFPLGREGLPPGTSPNARRPAYQLCHIRSGSRPTGARRSNTPKTSTSAGDFGPGERRPWSRGTRPSVCAKRCAQSITSALSTVPAWRLYNYPFSIPPLRLRGPSTTCRRRRHCAADALPGHAIPETELPNSSAWYGPSTLSRNGARSECAATYQLDDGDPQSAEETKANAEDAGIGENALLREEPTTTSAMTQLQCHLGTEQLARKSIKATLEDDPTMTRMWQKHLGKALMKWAHVRAASRTRTWRRRFRRRRQRRGRMNRCGGANARMRKRLDAGACGVRACACLRVSESR